jgi:predicted transposase YbfD/YdcC
MNKNFVSIESFRELDPRSRESMHDFLEIFAITMSAVICGMTGWDEIVLFAKERKKWLKKRLGLKLENGVPSRNTFARVISAIKPEKLQDAFSDWVLSVSTSNDTEIVALDGKTVRRSFERSKNKKAIHIINAWACNSGITLGQLATEEKSNEITAIPKLIDCLSLKGSVVTIDAMGCQKQIAESICEAKADYVLALKGNQGKLHGAVQSFLMNRINEGFKDVKHSYFETKLERGHGRIEVRKAWSLPIKGYENYFDGCKEWKNLKSIFAVKLESTNINTKEHNENFRYYISSLDVDAQRLLNISRAHWKIESMHWILDVCFNEDDSRIRINDAPANFSALRKIALTYLKQETTFNKGIKIKQKRAALSTDYLEVVLQLNI